jgi:RNA-binding protein
MDKQKKAHLLRQSHPLNPAVTVAEKGLTENVQLEIEAALKAHSLIKIKFSGYDKSNKQRLLSDICQTYGAELVQLIGHIGIVYRPKPPKKQAPLKRNVSTKARRVTKSESSRGNTARRERPSRSGEKTKNRPVTPRKGTGRSVWAKK